MRFLECQFFYTFLTGYIISEKKMLPWIFINFYNNIKEHLLKTWKVKGIVDSIYKRPYL